MAHPRFKLQGHEQEVVEIYLSGKSTLEIGKMFSVSVASVCQCLEKMNVPRRESDAVNRGRTHCKKGHPWVEENISINSRGCRVCRVCMRESGRKSRLKPATQDRMRTYRRNWMRKQRKENPDRVRNYHFTHDYGLTVEERNAKAEKQEQRCMICRRLMPLEVDHDHDTEQVRDLLCRPCNLAVGLLREDIATAENLVIYLKKWKTNAAPISDSTVI